MDYVSCGTRNEASSEAVLAALRESSKGKLVYENQWPSKNWWKKDATDGPESPHVSPSDQSSGESASGAQSPKSDDAQDLSAYVSGSDFDVSIHQYEEERLNSVREAMRKRIAEYEQHNHRWEEQAKKHLMLIEQNQTLEYQMQLDRLNQEYLEGLRELAEKSQKAREHHQSHVRHLRNKIKEAELKQKQEEEEEKKREAESKQRAESLRCQCKEMESTLASVRKALGECTFASFLATPVEDHRGLLDRMARQVAAFGALTAVSREDLRRVLDFATQLNTLVHSVVADVEQATKKGMALQKQEQPQAVENKVVETRVQEPDNSTQSPEPSPAAGSTGRVETSQLKRHADILDRLEQWQASYKELTQDKAQKKYCFDLLKAVTIPVNALSTSSSIKEKLDQLSAVLSGKSFKAGPRTISTSSHPLALRFCLDKLAEKIVLQGEEQIVSNEETAFPVAALAVGLWCRYPDLGDLLLGHFYMRCPALVPVFFSRSMASSESEYLRLCGYKCTENNLETESQFLRRITGLMRLYAALLQTPLPPVAQAHGQRQVAPAAGVGARLAVAGNVAGWALARDYGRQFRKVLHVLCKDYFPRLKQLVKTSSGPISRLEALLQQVLRKGHLARPEGSLGAQAWK
ncbi:hypothetical protein MTO96_017098 [Rhipicephalus appendiculatus]